MKKAISGLLALFLVLGLCAGCGGQSDDTPATPGEPGQSDPVRTPETDESNIYTRLLGVDPNETALTSEGNQIPMELYLYWLTYACGNLEYQLNMFSAYYGMYGELINEDGSVDWDGDLEGQAAGEVARRQAEDNALSYAILENVAARHNISLTDEDQAQLDKDKAAYVEQMGGREAYEQNLREMGVSEASFDRVSATTILYTHLMELARDPDSDLYMPPTDDDAYVDHILLMTTDSETGEPLDDEGIAEKRAQAEELLSQLQAADAGELEELFNRLAGEYCEDPGRAEQNGYLINPDTNFVPEFKEAAFALKPGEVSGIVESDYGYHILLRKELTEEQMDAVAGEHLSAYLDSVLVDARASLIRSDKLEEIDVGEFYEAYKKAVEAMYTQGDGTAE